MKKIILLTVFAFTATYTFATIRYVKPTVSGTGDGTSWANASGNLRTILLSAVSGDSIWVAAGTYNPTTLTDRTISFVIPSGVKMYGGFVGNESIGINLNRRDFVSNETILSGEIGGATKTDNTYHIVTTSNVNNQTIVDGLTITRGYGIGGSSFGNGGGWLNEGNSKPTLRNIQFIDNRGASGGAMYNNGFNGDASPVLINCVFIQNYATINGGAIYNRGTSGIANAILLNCTFFENTSDNLGGAIYNYIVTNLQVQNCILWDNVNLNGSSSASNDIYNDGTASQTSTTRIFNSITSIGGSIGGTTISSNVVSGNPNFTNASLYDLTLSASSTLAINQGNNALAVSKNDIANNQRIRNGTVDIGAYEYTGTPTKIYVDSSKVSTGLNQGHNWTNAFADLQDALALTTAEDTIWVAKGTYKPTATTVRAISFQIPDSVKVFGGFAGNEPSGYNLSLRNFTSNETILSGNIGSLINATDNSYNVVFTRNVSPQTVVDGLSVKDGFEDPFNFYNGGGWYNEGSNGNSNPTLINCIFSNNQALYGGGGAMYNVGSNGVASPTLTNCTFTLNTASYGGAIWNNGFSGIASPVLTNCTFTNNVAQEGGAVYINESSSPVLINCTFKNNTALNQGGAVFMIGTIEGIKTSFQNCLFYKNGKDHIGYNDGTVDTQPSFINCTFVGATNFAIDIVNWDSGQTPIDFTNCIFWQNNGDIVGTSSSTPSYGDNTHVNITYSIVEEALFTQAPYAGNNNINQDPKFVGAASGIFNLRCDSPAINAGTTGGSPLTDITGFTRVGNPDMGAYEFGHAEVENDIASGANPILNGTPYIKASSKILNTNNALYQGARFVEMLPGFEVAPVTGAASVFRAEVGGGCTM